MEAEPNHGGGCSCAGYEVTDKGMPSSYADDDLYEVIDIEGIRCLNEDITYSCQKVFRPFSDRLLLSDSHLKPPSGDPEILLIVPFKEEVKVRAITLYAGNIGKPEEIGLWSNKENFDFSLVEEEIPVNNLALNSWTPCNGIEVLTQ
jgi:PITH domain